MADQQSGAGPSNDPPKAIASLAKKQGDVTRLGTQKLKFVPTLPVRRKKEDVKQEEAPVAAPSTDAGRGRGRGERGRGRGRGEGRGGTSRPSAEMIASGPFAMGPALAGTSARRTAPRANFTPIVPQGPAGSSSLGAGLTGSKPPTLGGVKKESDDRTAGGKSKDVKQDAEDEEVYSDPDEGVEIVDMDKVKNMDWMAPESLKKERDSVKKRLKKEEQDRDTKGKQKAQHASMETDEDEAAPGKVNLANAVDLSESEEEEDLENIIDDFAALPIDDMDTGAPISQDRLYFFQFPTPFPTFVSKSNSLGAEPSGELPASKTKKVKFTEDTKPPATPEASVTPAPEGEKASDKADPKLDGIVGQLEMYQSGAVKMRLGNGILLDVSAATHPSFLQHAVYLDTANKHLCVLGEVSRRFVVSPDIQTLLTGMDISERPAPDGLDDDGLISMDTS